MFKRLLIGIGLVALAGCGGISALVQPTATVPATATRMSANLTDVEAAARAVIQAMTLVNYKDPSLWKNQMLALSTEDGKQFWQLNFDRMLADVIAHKRVAEAVTIQQVTVLGQESRTDAQGKTTRAAMVLVTGRIVYADDAGRHDEPINQPLMLANLDGQWKFVTLISPEALREYTRR